MSINKHLARAPTGSDISRTTEYPSITRIQSIYNPLCTFVLEKEKTYQQQYGDLYFLRLALLKPAVDAIAEDGWEGFQVGSTLRCSGSDG